LFDGKLHTILTLNTKTNIIFKFKVN